MASDEQPLDDAQNRGADARVDNLSPTDSSSEVTSENDPNVTPEAPPESAPEDTPASDDAGTLDENDANSSGDGDSLDEEGEGGKHDEKSEQNETKKGKNDSDSPASSDPDKKGDGDVDDPSKSKDGSNADETDPSKNGDKSDENQDPEDGGDGDKKTPDGDGGSDDDESGGGDNEGSGDSDIGREPGTRFDADGADEDLPDNVKRVGAIGNAAIVTAVLGGADGDVNLIAADDDLLTSSASEVLDARGINDAVVGWSADGVDEGTADLETLLSLDLDACLITVGDDTLSEPEQEALIEDGVNIVYVPRMDSQDGIIGCVARVANLLAKGGDAKATDVANAYIDFYGGISSTVSSASSSVYALYVDEWVGSVRYQGPLSDQILVNGIAMAPAGLAAEPLGTYLRMAGVLNPAIEKTRYTLRSSKSIVWPFIGGTNDDDWSGISDVNGGKGTTGHDYELALTRITINSYDIDLGTPEYPAIIVSSAEVKTNIKSDRDDGGIYSAKAHESSSIASDSYDIYVNPHGVFSSWTAGSLESILESAWAYSVFQTGDEGYFEDAVRTFYSDFYGYELGGLYDSIADGSFAE